MLLKEKTVGAFRLASHPDYVETHIFDDLRATDYAALDEQGHLYFDYTGCNLYPSRLLHEHAELLQNSVFGNPHSTNPTSKLSTVLVEKARSQVLDFFNASDDYFCVFTSNASGALKIVGENYPWSPESAYLLAFDNHNSVNGIREYARRRGADSVYVPLLYQNLRLDEGALHEALQQPSNSAPRLFALPAQSNVSGVKHPLSYIAEAQANGWDVLLDAAAFVPTTKLDLKEYQPDFVSVSFYKIFGYPTGIGCLLIKKSSFDKLDKHWFAGGTVSYVSVRAQKHYLINNHERFEDGTLNYLGIPAISLGLNFIQSLGMDKINRRVMVLTDWLLRSLLALRYDNGRPMIYVFGPTDLVDRGGTIILNMLDRQGNTIPYYNVEPKANAAKISLRTGCFCNPGIDEVNTCMSTEELMSYFSDGKGVDFKEIENFFGKLRGALRISVGFVTNSSDVERLLNFFEQTALESQKK
jgi:molybdenum cofactor sulfurtransferase